jgi:hypothetical protein
MLRTRLDRVNCKLPVSDPIVLLLLKGHDSYSFYLDKRLPPYESVAKLKNSVTTAYRWKVLFSFAFNQIQFEQMSRIHLTLPRSDCGLTLGRGCGDPPFAPNGVGRENLG